MGGARINERVKPWHLNLGNRVGGIKDDNRNSGFMTKCVVTGHKGEEAAEVPRAQ